MKSEELREQITIELELMETTVEELLAIRQDATKRQLTVREKTAAAAFLAQFYSGVENILKRISYFYNIPLPSGNSWHVELFRQFCSPSKHPLPALFDEPLASALAPFRKFRHAVYHSYGIQLEWSRMSAGVAEVEDVFREFQSRLSTFLQTLK